MLTKIYKMCTVCTVFHPILSIHTPSNTTHNKRKRFHWPIFTIQKMNYQTFLIFIFSRFWIKNFVQGTIKKSKTVRKLTDARLAI